MKFSVENITSIFSFLVALLYLLQISFLSKSLNRGFIYFKLYLANLTFIVFFFLLTNLGVSSVAKYLIPFLVCSVLLIAPLIYFYVTSLCSSETIIKPNKHILPPVIIGAVLLLIVVVNYFSHDKEFKIFIIQIMTFITLASITGLFIIQNAFYLFKAFKLYNQHQKKIKDVFSYTENVDLKWVRVLLYGYLVFIVLLIIVNVYNSKASDIAFDVLMTIYIIYIGINAIRQKEIYFATPEQIVNPEYAEDQIQPLSIEEVQPDNDKKEEDNEQKKKLFESLKQDITLKMEQDKVYRDQDLTIYKLSKLLGTNSKYVSTVINTFFEKTFVNFINEYRINEAKENLISEKYKNYTIEAHGNQVGFKSKSSFNLAFKKMVGITPSEFIKTSH